VTGGVPSGSAPGSGPPGPGPQGGSGPVAPGSGWPEDPACADTAVAHSAAEVRELAAGASDLAGLTARQSVCRACPRLVEWREQVAAERRKSWRHERYWGRPVPGWGDPRPRVLIVGLAPAAHGGNRTGRIFTGDRSGDFLFASLHRCGLATLPTSTAAGDGQRLIGARMVAAVRCSPPLNKPSLAERDTCAPWLAAEFGLVAGSLRVIVCLGAFAWQAAWSFLRSAAFTLPRPRPAFGHGTEVLVTPPGTGPGGAGGDVTGGTSEQAIPSGGQMVMLGCYHPSQQNTFTGRVTPAMLDAVFQRAREMAGAPPEAGYST
jgi:uracil-DNA glycosylase